MKKLKGYYHNFLKWVGVEVEPIINKQSRIYSSENRTPLVVSGAALCAALLGTGVRRCLH